MAIATMEACPLAGRIQSIGYAACAGVEVGSVHVGGVGFPLTYERDDPLVGAVLEARVIRRLIGPFAASLGAGLRAPFVRKQYYSVDAAGEPREVFLSSPIAGTLDLSIGVDL